MVFFRAISVLSLLLVPCVLAKQTPLQPANPAAQVQTARLASLASESDSDYASFTHPSFPAHGLRIKKVSNFCDTSVNTYAGYLDFASAGSKHLFFWFFESRSKPDEDDVIMWINGGPGASSGIGAFMELGPCQINLDADKSSSNRTVWNPYGWNNNANLFFLEQPVGVGFSYADDDSHIFDTPSAAQDVVAFITIFFDVFNEFKDRAFHIAGESYGGRYVPVFASALYDAIEKGKKDGKEVRVKFESVLIGNGITEPIETELSKFDMLCTGATGHAPPINIATCVELQKTVPYCRSWLKKGCLDHFDTLECGAAHRFCGTMFEEAIKELGLNRYDLRKKCKGYLCYEEIDATAEWLNLNATRKALGLPSSVPPYASSSEIVATDFTIGHDRLYRSDYYVSQLLERGVRVLIYAGIADSACSWMGNKRVYEALDWTGHDAFNAAPTRDWTVSPPSAGSGLATFTVADDVSVKGEVAGTIRSADGLTFVTIREAGHMVPFDKPVESLAMLQAWLRGDLA